VSNNWTPLWNIIVDSSLWEEEDWVCKVFITMLAIKDPDHVVRLTAYQIGKKANKSEAEVLKALEILSQPDKKRIEPQEFEGRRVKRVDGGWLMLNGKKYQEMVQDLIRQRQQAQWMRDERMIERAVVNREGLDPSRLSPALRARYEKAKAKYADKAVNKAKGKPLPGEEAYVAAVKNGELEEDLIGENRRAARDEEGSGWLAGRGEVGQADINAAVETGLEPGDLGGGGF